MDLQSLRTRIDEIDERLIELFEARMAISADIARYKRSNNLLIYDPFREQEKLEQLAIQSKSEYAEYARELYTLIFSLSRREQERTGKNSEEG